MRDAPLRRAVKAVALACFTVDVAFARGWRRLRGPRAHGLGGTCGRCARCCEAPAIRVGRLTWYLPSLRALFLGWHRVVNGFELVARDPRQRTFTFRCTHFDAATRLCDSYATRPGMCRDYPRVLLEQPFPEMLPGCGYRPVAPGAETLLRELRRLPLTPEQDAKLRRELHLDA
jgi:Fe-S-cluster containining protein